MLFTVIWYINCVHCYMVFSVPPRWITKPESTFVIRLNTVYLDCMAAGIPDPNITWSKNTGLVTLNYMLSLIIQSLNICLMPICVSAAT